MKLRPKKLLDTSASNTKIAKTVKVAAGAVRVASLSLMPDYIVCPGSKAAGCFKACLKSAGMGSFSNTAAGRQAKTDYWHEEREKFLDQLRRELRNFSKLCAKQKVQPWVRLNTISDIEWEKYGIPQEFPEIQFLDYTKRVARLGKTPANYKLIFSYSGREQYAAQVERAQKTDAPIAVVFNGPMPGEFMGRKVIDGDASDLVNVHAGPVIVGLKAKGKAKKDETGFVVDTSNIIAMG